MPAVAGVALSAVQALGPLPVSTGAGLVFTGTGPVCTRAGPGGPPPRGWRCWSARGMGVAERCASVENGLPGL